MKEMVSQFGLRFLFILVLLPASFSLFAQKDSIPPIDKSPMDMSYCPPFYPIHKAQDRITEPLVARVVYSRPGKNNRQIFGKLVEFGKLWRLGANEATEIEFYKEVVINKIKIKKGKYTLYAIPNESSCTLIFNKETDTWGAFLYDEKKDVLRVVLPVQAPQQPLENFTIYFLLKDSEAKMFVGWDNYSFTLPFSVLKISK